MKLTDFARATDSDYRYLQEQIDVLPRQKSLGFVCCELPPGCVPRSATVSFCKGASAHYAMFLDSDVRYSGNNRAVRLLTERQHLHFQSFNEMRRFFELLPTEPTPTVEPRETPSTHLSDTYNFNTVVDMDELTLSATTTSSAPDYPAIRRELAKSIIGQDAAVETIAHQVALHLKKSNPKKPLSLVMHGPPGTGKSETAKLLAKTLSRLGPHQYSDVWTDLNQYAEAHSVYRLIGSPPGYIGYDDKPVFEAVTQNPYTVFVFDELDKAHSDVLKTFMAILDEGRCAARKEQDDHSREYDFRHCIFIFTSNYRLDTSAKRRMGFSVSDDVEDIRSNEGAIEVDYHSDIPGDENADLTRRIYANTESARKAFVAAGILREIASRFSCFVEFTKLSDEAKIRIFAKQVVETGFEYDVRLAHISPAIMQALINASTSEHALTVRSFKSVIEGYLAAAFAEAAVRFRGQAVRLEGSIEAPQISHV